jgi:hypothetical protein
VICTMMGPWKHALQRTNTANWKQIFPEKELSGHSPNFHIHVSVSVLYIPTIDLICCRKYVDRSWEYINRSQAQECDVETGTGAAQFPEKEYINGIFVAVRATPPALAGDAQLRASVNSMQLPV